MDDCREAQEATLSKLCRAYTAAVLAGDEIAAELAIHDAMEAKLSAAQIDDEIITPALWFVGDLWARGEISVADEHLATEISIRVLALSHEARRVAGARGEHKVMLAALAGELHVVALRMTGDLLREAGYPVLMLGADVPTPALATAAARHRPDVIGLTATMPGAGDRLLIAIHEVQQRWPAAAFVVGGAGVAPRVRSRPGIVVCERVSEAVASVDALVKRADLN